MKLYRLFALAVLTVITALPLWAQKKPKENANVLVSVRIAGFAVGSGQSFGARLWEVGQPNSMDVSTATQSTTGWSYSSPQYVPMTPGKHYQMSIGSGAWQYGEVLFSPPPGYSIRINDRAMRSFRTVTNYQGGGGSEVIYKVVLVADDGSEALLPGRAIPPRVGDIIWAIGLGRLSNGMPAGSIQLRATAITADLGQPDSLIYTPPSTPEVQIISDGDVARRFIRTPQAFVYFSENGTIGSYDINFYGSNVTSYVKGGDGPWHMYNGDTLLAPFVTYRVTYSGPGELIIDRFDLENGRVVSSETWTLTQSGSDWTINDSSALRRIVLTSTTNRGVRTENVVVQDNPVSGSPTISSKSRRVYEGMPWGQEELVTEISDPDGMALTTTYSYNQDFGTGGYGRLASVQRANGSWESYIYDDSNQGFGNMLSVRRPWGNGPTSPSAATAGNCDASIYSFTGERGGSQAAFFETLTGVQRVVNGITTSKSEFSTDFSQTGQDNQPLRSVTTYSYASAAAAEVSSAKYYHNVYTGDWGAYDFAGQLYSSVAADGTQVSVYHGRGTLSDGTWYLSGWDLTTFTPNPSAGFVCESRLYGTSSPNAGGTRITTHFGAAIEPIYMVPNISTRVDYIRSPDGGSSWELRYVYLGGSDFKMIGWQKKGYDRGQPYIEGNSDGTVRGWAYTASGIQAWRSTAEGTFLNDSLDPLGRVVRRESSYVNASEGMPAQPTVYTHYTYDSSDRVLSIRTSNSSDPSQAGPTESYQYSLAGLKTSSTSSTGLNTAYGYSNGLRTLTTTLPGGATVVTNSNLDGTLESKTGTGCVAEYYSYSVNADGTISAQTTVASPNSGRWSRVTRDWMGRTIKEEHPSFGGGVFQKTSSYNSAGQVVRTSETGIADTLFQYDALGQLQYTALDVNRNGVVDLAGPDRVTEGRTQVVNQNGIWYSQTLSYTYAGSSASRTLMSETLTRLRPYPFDDGVFNSKRGYRETRSYDVFRNLTVTTVIIESSTNTTTTRTDVPNSTVDEVTVSRAGLVQKTTTAQNLSTTYQYDGLQRLVATVDPRLGATTQGYYAESESPGVRNQLAWVRDTAGSTTSYNYEQATGRLAVEINALGKSVHYAYDSLGRVVRTWGEATYPVEYEFNSLGEKTKMRTFRDTSVSFAGASWPYTGYPSASDKGDYTTWNYETATGLLTSKVDAQNRAVVYTYNPRGQLATRTWARGVVTTYGYDANTAEQTSISYSDGTPALAYAYDRRGQTVSVTDYTGTRTFEHCDCGKITAEYLPAFFQNREVHWFLDTSTEGAKGRTTSLTMGTSGNGTNEYSIGYGYDGWGRVNYVGGISYGYTGNSNLIYSAADDGGQWVQYRLYEPNRNLLSWIETDYASTTSARFDYGYDPLGRRTSRLERGAIFGSYLGQGLQTSWGYNDRSELTSSQTVFQNTTTQMVGRSYGYDYDPIGNRVTSSLDGVQSSYTANSLNQYTQRTEPGKVLAAGLAPASSTVTVNSQAATRQGDYFARFVDTSNSSGSVWASLNVASNFGGASVRSAFVPQTPEVYGYDNDGNVTADGRWTYEWDGENRLVAMQTRDMAYNVGAPRQRIEYRYDFLGRRVLKSARSWTSSGWAVVSERRFVYDGWNMIAEFDTTSGFSRKALYVWGIDLSGDLQNAGGIGGLVRIHQYGSGGETILLPSYDGNGNIYGLVDRATGALRAAYEYSPYGETLRASGDLAGENPYRFSTKYTDNETQLLYYGFRYYSPSLGRFYGRDPIGEKGGLHLYGFVANGPVNRWDYLGQDFSYSCFDDERGDYYLCDSDPEVRIDYGPQDPGNYVDQLNAQVDSMVAANNALYDGIRALNQAKVEAQISAGMGQIVSGLDIGGLADALTNGIAYDSGLVTGGAQVGGVYAAIADVSGKGRIDAYAGSDGSFSISRTVTASPAVAVPAPNTAASSGPVTYNGTINYKAGALILSYGTFTGTVTSNTNPAQTYTISGRLDGVGIQVGYIKGDANVTFIANSPQGMLGSNGGFWTASIGLGAGPLNIISGDITINAHNTGNNRSEFGAINPDWTPPKLSTDTTALNPGDYIDKKPGIGFSAGFWGITVQKVTPVQPPPPPPTSPPPPIK